MANPLNSLNALGWNVLRLPRQGFGPLDVLGRENAGWNKLGTLDQICRSPVAIPVAQQSQVSDILLKKSGGWSFGIELDFLKDLLKNFGISAPAGSSDWKSSNSCRIEFKNPVASAIPYFTLFNYVRGGELERDLLEPFLDRDRGLAILVIAEVLQAKAISVTTSADRDSDVSAGVDGVAGVGAVKGNVSNRAGNSDALIYNGTELLTFGFKAYSLGLLDSKWKLAGAGIGDEFSFADNEDSGVPAVIDGLIDINLRGAD